jgi:hypothetical protein
MKRSGNPAFRLLPCRARAVRVAGLIIVAITVASCDDEKPEYTLKEVIDVQGTCAEDHVGQEDHYAGQIVRWQSVKNGAVSTYGFLSKPLLPKDVIDEATHPTVYHTPLTMSFMKIEIDTSQPAWVLHGVSDRGEESEQGYDSTCELEVVKRGMEIRGLPSSPKITAK